MALQYYVYDTETGACTTRDIVPHTKVTSLDGSVIVTPVTGPDGQAIYDLEVSFQDVNIDNMVYDETTHVIKVTETDGSIHEVDLSGLVADITTSVVTNTVSGFRVATHNDGDGNLVDIDVPIPTLENTGGSLRFTSIDGSITDVSICELLNDITDNGLILGG